MKNEVHDDDITKHLSDFTSGFYLKVGKLLADQPKKKLVQDLHIFKFRIELKMMGGDLHNNTRQNYGSLPRRKFDQNHNQIQSPSKSKVKSIVAMNNDDWKFLQNSITHLFHKKKLQGLQLDVLNERVRNVHDSEIGQFICEYYQESILKKGMIILRENVKEKSGSVLLEKLADVWTQFYTIIFPTLLAIFYPIQEQGLSIRAVTLVGFRDIVLLKTKIDDALKPKQEVSSSIKQMLLVLAAVHDTHQPNENYMKLEALAARVIQPFMGFHGLYIEETAPKRRISSTNNPNDSMGKSRRLSRSQTFNDDGRKRSATDNTAYIDDIAYARRYSGTIERNRKNTILHEDDY